MQNYINQLIEDLKEAKNHVPPAPKLSEDYEEFEKQMFAMETAPNVSMKTLFGVSYEELPPPEKLTGEQMQQLINVIFETWEAFNCSAAFPEDVPLRLQYELVRDQFADPIHYMPGYSMHYDFCCGWCPECKIIDFCTTKDDIWTKEELEEERRKNS